LRVVNTHSGTEIATLRLPTRSEHYITVHSMGASRDVLRCVAAKENAFILSQSVFAGNDLSFDSVGRNVDWPLMWLRSTARTNGVSSSQAVAISGTVPVPVLSDGRHIGFIYEDNHARYCRLHGLVPSDLSSARGEQAQSVFETAAAVLARSGFRFTDTVRTWIYLDHLLEWYDEFNAVRTSFFEKVGVLDHMIPASTGVGTGNQSGAAITMAVLAVQPKSPECTVQTVSSPLQNSALEYRSAFSRAIEISSPTHRNLIISGTASIGLDGSTVHRDDPEKQIRLTMKTVEAILESRQMKWNDLCRGIAYFKDMAYFPIFRRILTELNIPRFPIEATCADICRQNLLFEIEVDAARTRFSQEQYS